MRLTGFDFYADGRRAAVCTWDGDVWLVEGIDAPGKGLTWQRIASGLFQPLGLKIVKDKVYVSCRDQIVILHDLNGDGETDFYECFNNDHQVTEHFHEFAMGLQTDAEGNFYYAKAARHALQSGGAASRHAPESQQGRLEDGHPCNGLPRSQRRLRQPGRHVLSDGPGRFLGAEEPHRPRRTRRLLRQLLGLHRRDRSFRRGDEAARSAGSRTPSTARRPNCSGSRATAGGR